MGGLSLVSPGSAAAEARTLALFAGVADYQFAKGKAPGASVPELGGAPQDLRNIQAGLSARVKLAEQRTLLNAQATRAAILTSLSDLISSARPGDTVLFYFSGHGAQMFDTSGRQASGYSSTILPYDARDPSIRDPAKAGDIVDVELGDLIDTATAAGVNVVTIFDACNSGTATRSPFRPEGFVRNRFAPALTAAAPVRSVRRSAPSPTARAGYRVHLAATPDGEVAQERLVDGHWRGDFTSALSSALYELPPGATYGDVLGRVRLKLQTSGSRQEVRGEGELSTAFLGAERSQTRQTTARRLADGNYEIMAGSLAGIAPGARYAAYGSGGEAAAGGKPLARGVVVSADPWTSRIDFDAALPGAPPEVHLRETERSFANRRLKVALRRGGAGDPTLDRILRDLTFVTVVEADPDIGIDLTTPGLAKVMTADGEPIKTLELRNAASIEQAMKSLAAYHALLALVGSESGAKLTLRLSATNCEGLDPLSVDFVDGEPSLISGAQGRDRFHLLITNDEESRSLYAYTFILGADYSIALTDPPSGDNPQPLQAGQCYNRRYRASGSGRDHVLVIAADRPLPALNLLEQDAVRGGDALQALLGDATRGLRSSGSAPVGTWSVSTVSYRVGAQPDASPQKDPR